MTAVSRGIDRIEVTFDEPNLVANAGLLLVATLVGHLGLEALINKTVLLSGRIGGALPGRKVLTLVHAMTAGASHIDHADILRSGATEKVLGHRVMAPSTLGTFLRSFTFGHIRQLDRVLAESLRKAWSCGAGPGSAELVLDVDSTICEVCGKHKGGSGYGYTKKLCYHPILAMRAATGEVLHARRRRGGANTSRGAVRFIEELVCSRENSRGNRTTPHEVRLGFLVERDDRHLGASRRRLHDGREDGEVREGKGVIDRRVRLEADRIHR